MRAGKVVLVVIGTPIALIGFGLLSGAKCSQWFATTEPSWSKEAS